MRILSPERRVCTLDTATAAAGRAPLHRSPRKRFSSSTLMTLPKPLEALQYYTTWWTALTGTAATVWADVLCCCMPPDEVVVVQHPDANTPIRTLGFKQHTMGVSPCCSCTVKP